MNIIYFLLSIFFTKTLGFNNKNSPYMFINKECFHIVHQRKYRCDDINNILAITQHKGEYIEHVCDPAFYGSFTNNQLSEYINSELHKKGLYNCNVNVSGEFGSKQLKDTCQTEFNKYCTSNSNLYSFSEWLF